ncbi:F-box/kelch-repeat protein At3g23880-like isoform X2 [Quercus lobata]|uniref:F-box/kelch-repeat protein At3g23880-like isoform X2 n=1 Tax=Quercus lobata TaxID=97700 RepID=UPI001248852E|nr:F-box/kelch-repeat protein At3g23880-like isoform X2 [Quercus lobata]
MKFFFQYYTNHRSRRIRKSTKRRRIRRTRRRESTPTPTPLISQITKKPPSSSTPCTTIMDLPGHTLIDILSRLPLNSILVSRCVCTTWRCLISDPLFTYFYLSRPQQPLELFLRSNSLSHVTTTLHWVDTHSILNTSPPFHPNHHHQTQLNTKLYLPLAHSDPEGEFITVPKSVDDNSLWGSVVPGFGHCRKSNKFKVVRLVFRLENIFQRMTEVYTLGTASWRSIGPAPFDLDLSLFATYLNGVIHWLRVSDNEKGSIFIVGFDFEEERFNEFPLPPHFGEKHKEKENLHHLNMGVLGDCLSVCDCTLVDHMDIWMMKEYGDPTSWTKEYVISTHFGGPYRPIMLLDNGDLLMIYGKRELYVYNPIERHFRFLVIHGVQSVFEAITHVPSFIPLKDAVGGDHLNVQNVKASCSDHGFLGGPETLYLVEQGEPRNESQLAFFWGDSGEE